MTALPGFRVRKLLRLAALGLVFLLPLHPAAAVPGLQDLVIPTAFSPNGDGVNDVFAVPGIDQFNQVELRVFNRWGQEVYADSDYAPDNFWAGQNNAGNALPAGTYFVVLEFGSARPTYEGHVTLTR